MANYGGGYKISGSINVSGSGSFTVPANSFAIVQVISAASASGASTVTVTNGINSMFFTVAIHTQQIIYLGAGAVVSIDTNSNLQGVYFINGP